MKLSTSQMFYLWRKLAWSKSAVASVVRVLAHLKNRSNRYPSLSRAAFGANRQAMEIVASEYNLGATNSPETAAGPTWYGQAVYGICTGGGSSGFRALAPNFTQFAHP